MSGSSFGVIFRLTTWGESHGPAVGVVVDGCPAGLPLEVGDVQRELDRRRPGQSDVTTPRQERDRVEILSGVFEGKTTGTPISMMVWNQDVDSTRYEALRHTPRPGHADYTYQVKYGRRDHRGGGRASARETVARVAGGAVAKKLLATRGIEILGHVIEIGGIQSSVRELEAIRRAEENPVRCADPDAAEQMRAMIHTVKARGDSLGGIVEVLALGVPPGLGEPVFDKLEADLAKGLMSIGAVKGFEIGAGFQAARMRGSQMNDPFQIQEGEIHAVSNNAGGVLGGISNGETILLRIAVKPTPSIALEQKTVNLQSLEETSIRIEGRHDPAIPPRIVPVAEAMTALVLADHMLRSGFINPSKID